MSVQYGVPLDPKKYAVKWPYSWWAFVCFVFFLLLGLVVFFWALFSDDLPADGTFASFVFSMVAAWAGISFICSISVLLAGMSIFLWRVLVGRRGYAFQDMSGRTTRSVNPPPVVLGNDDKWYHHGPLDTNSEKYNELDDVESAKAQSRFYKHHNCAQGRVARIRVGGIFRKCKILPVGRKSTNRWYIRTWNGDDIWFISPADEAIMVSKDRFGRFLQFIDDYSGVYSLVADRWQADMQHRETEAELQKAYSLMDRLGQAVTYSLRMSQRNHRTMGRSKHGQWYMGLMGWVIEKLPTELRERWSDDIEDVLGIHQDELTDATAALQKAWAKEQDDVPAALVEIDKGCLTDLTQVETAKGWTDRQEMPVVFPPPSPPQPDIVPPPPVPVVED